MIFIIAFDSYDRELERYYRFYSINEVEKIFYKDSLVAINYILCLKVSAQI